MKQIVSWLKQLQIAKILVICIAGFSLLLTTACNPGNIQGARPNNPPVQMGGNNNPYDAGGDGYNNYKMSADPKVSGSHGGSYSKKEANLRSSLNNLGQLVADSHGIKSNAAEDLLYPGESATTSGHPDIGPVGNEYEKKLVRNTQKAPSDRQRVIQRSDPDQKILEKIGDQFEEASEFIQDSFEGQAK
ncbi:MAG TPA: DUF6658 family protein [Trichocoleus sp.]